MGNRDGRAAVTPRWRVEFDPQGETVHARPRNDLIWHPLTEDCVCGPAMEVCYRIVDDAPVPLLMHHSLDGREADE